MGKLKEKLLNNLSEQEMDEQYELSAFEYVELISKYKNKNEEEYIPTDEYVDSLTDEQIDEAFAEHNADEDEIDRINDSLRLKFTEDDVIEAVKALKNEDWFINGIRRELNSIWNRKNGVF